MRMGTSIWKGLLRSRWQMRCVKYLNTTGRQCLPPLDFRQAAPGDRTRYRRPVKRAETICVFCVHPPSFALKPCLSCGTSRLATWAETVRERSLSRPRSEQGSIGRDHCAGLPAHPAGSRDTVWVGEIGRFFSVPHGTGPSGCKVPAGCTSQCRAREPASAASPPG